MSTDELKADDSTAPRIEDSDSAETVVDMDQRAQLEQDSRPNRLAALQSKVDQYFSADSELKEDITNRSFNVPQFGQYHTEGFLMDTHLDLIFQNIQRISSGVFSKEISPEIRQMMGMVVSSNRESLEMYALLHDVSKPDCLTLKYQDGKEEEITWEQWLKMIPEGAIGSPVQIKAFCEEKGLKSISYVQEGKTHGKAGADRLAGVKEKVNIPDILLKAIEKHEVAFQFSAVDATVYKRHFGDLSDEETAWVFTASYIDTSSSLRESGKPDLKNFINMVESRHNYLVLAAVEKELRPGGKAIPGLDVAKLKAKIDRGLYQTKEKIAGTPAEVVERLRQECKISVYDRTKFQTNLQALVITGQITQTDLDDLMAGLTQSGELDWKLLGRVKGRLSAKWNLIQSALEVSEIK